MLNDISIALIFTALGYILTHIADWQFNCKVKWLGSVLLTATLTVPLCCLKIILDRQFGSIV